MNHGLLQVAVADVRPDDRVDEELEAVRRRRRVRAADVFDGEVAVEQEQAAGFVRRFVTSVRRDLGAKLGRHYHQSVRSIEVATSSASQKPALRYFQPASAR